MPTIHKENGNAHGCILLPRIVCQDREYLDQQNEDVCQCNACILQQRKQKDKTLRAGKRDEADSTFAVDACADKVYMHIYINTCIYINIF